MSLGWWGLVAPRECGGGRLWCRSLEVLRLHENDWVLLLRVSHSCEKMLGVQALDQSWGWKIIMWACFPAVFGVSTVNSSIKEERKEGWEEERKKGK